MSNKNLHPEIRKLIEELDSLASSGVDIDKIVQELQNRLSLISSQQQNAINLGEGSVSQGSGAAAGAHGIAVGGDVQGDINLENITQSIQFEKKTGR